MLDAARFILSRSKLLEQYKKVKSISDIVSYSVKTNPVVAGVLESETSCLFSMHTPDTAKTIKDKSRVIFFAQAWDNEELGKALGQGINKFVVDNQKDLNVLLEYLKNKEDKITLFLRMRMKEYTVSTGKHFVFGMYSKEINELIPKLRYNKNIEKLGIHFHRKTQNISEWNIKGDIEKMLDEEALNSISLFNIGGGIPVDYHNTSASHLYDGIFSSINAFRKWLNARGIQMIAEPGRFLAGQAIKLEATIMNVYDNTIVVNCSVYNAAMDTFVAHVRLEVEGELTSEARQFGKGKPYTIKGMTPDSMDILRYKVLLESPKPGDKIIFLNAGAYNFATDFCGLKKLETVVAD
ncbi:MAG: decarboxylase [Candidatus Aenigmarchaeota archaeon]|nr:decarboxylase [Candidatus Aenigmarchaeota archaeon]